MWSSLWPNVVQCGMCDDDDDDDDDDNDDDLSVFGEHAGVFGGGRSAALGSRLAILRTICVFLWSRFAT